MAACDPHELRAWLRLLLTPRVGLLGARKLLAALGSPQAVFDAAPSTLAALVGPREVASLQTPPEALDAHVQRTLAWLAEPVAAQRAVLTLADTAYPRALLQAPDPPLLLFVQGRLDLLHAPSVAMVGSRNPTAQGRDNAMAFAQALSASGLTVVSGLADGIDAAAHEGALTALEPASGSTLAVVGTGLDVVYPRKHADLAARISQHGVMLSEFLLGTPPVAANFPKRNRIVAALSRGTLVVEAAVQSGSLITARMAMDMGREVLAIPGSIHSPQSRGCHALIKQGAKLVETAQDVMDELQWGQGRQAALDWAEPTGASSATEADAESDAADIDSVLAAMGYEPISQEALSARVGLGAAELGARLLTLELDGLVARMPGQLFQRLGRA